MIYYIYLYINNFCLTVLLVYSENRSLATVVKIMAVRFIRERFPENYVSFFSSSRCTLLLLVVDGGGDPPGDA